MLFVPIDFIMISHQFNFNTRRQTCYYYTQTLINKFVWKPFIFWLSTTFMILPFDDDVLVLSITLCSQKRGRKKH